jgi:hypothetical protein
LDSALNVRQSSAELARVALLISYILGAASSVILIVVVLRRHDGGDTVLADSIGRCADCSKALAISKTIWSRRQHNGTACSVTRASAGIGAS